MRRYPARLATATGVAALALATLATPAYADEARGGGPVSCELGQTVELAFTVTDSALATTMTWTTGDGVTRSGYWSAGRHHTYDTGAQSLRSWSASTEGNFVSVGPSCIG